MKISQSQDMKSYTRALWTSYLMAGAAKAVMLGEVAEHLYVSPPDELLSGEDVVAYAAVSGFGDDIRDAAEQIYESPESVMPYGALSREMRPEDFMDRLMDAVISHTTWYDADLVRQNPYYQAVQLMKPAHSGDLELAMRDTLPYEFIQSYHAHHDKTDPFFASDIGFFTEKVAFPALLEKDRVWMSIVMSEIESMAAGIDAAHGHVVTYGLGLGYYAFMAAQKPEVEKVTAVELSPDVIRLFKANILPQFPHPEKIEIVQGDAYDFLTHQADGAYDFGYADFWAGVIDGPALYLKFLPLAKRFQKTRFEYWIESVFIDLYFRPVVMGLLMDKVLGRSVDVDSEEPAITKLQRDFGRWLSHEPIQLQMPEDVDELLTPKRMTALVREWGEERR